MTGGAEPRFVNIAEMLRIRAASDRDSTAFTFLASAGAGPLAVVGALTYGALYERSCATAGALRERFGVGSRIVLAVERPEEFVPLFFGCVLGGLVAVPVSRPTRADRVDKLKAIVADCGATAVIVGAGPGDYMPSASDVTCDVVGAATILAAAEAAAAMFDDGLTPDTLAWLQYTSGSTGTPKGVMARHSDVLANMKMIEGCFDATRNDVWISWLPVYHDLGLAGNVIEPLYAGGTCILMHPSAFVRDPLSWLETISRYRGSISGAPNFAFEMCVRARQRLGDRRLDLSSWRVAYNGAEPVREATLGRFSDAFGTYGFRSEAHFPCYGMAEATLMLTGGPVSEAVRVIALDAAELEQGHVVDARAAGDDRRQTRIVGCGRPVNGVHVRIVDASTLTPCAESEVGEIWVSGPNIAGGYFGRTEATRSTFGATIASDARAYLRTGDLGFLRDDQLYITGRLKDLVVIHGRNLHPQDIEDAATTAHAAFAGRRGAAFSIAGDLSEQLVVVQEATPQHVPPGQDGALRDCLRQAIAQALDIAVTHAVLVAPGSIPVTTSGKVRRGECRERYLSGTLERLGGSGASARADSA